VVAAIAIPAIIVAFVLGLGLAGQPATVAFAQNPQSAAEVSAGTTIPMVTPEGESPFVKVASQVIPTVVNISADRKAEGSPFDQFFPKDFPFPFQLPTPQPQETHSLGSGVLISSDGYIVTNNHVVNGADKISVTLPDKTSFKGDQVKVIGADPVTDIALLKVNAEKRLPSIGWADSDSVKVGEWAIAVGNPFGLNGTVTVGVISAKGRSGIPLSEGPSIQDFLQTDASINPGNSGGPLVNIKGQIVGINSAIRSPVGANVGIGFAVPANMARQVADQLRTTGKIAHGYLGIRPQEVTESVKDAMGLSGTAGVLVGEVVDNTPAKRAGLQVGDVITAFNGKSIEDVQHFRSLVAGTAPNTTATIDLVRDGRKLELKADLANFPTENLAAAPAQPETWHGLKVENLTAADKQQGEVKSGVIVRAVTPGSAADDAGFTVSDVISRIVVKARDINERIENVNDFKAVTAALEDYKKAIAIQIQRNQGTQIITLTPTK
jgi:serine protease Do